MLIFMLRPQVPACFGFTIAYLMKTKILDSLSKRKDLEPTFDVDIIRIEKTSRPDEVKSFDSRDWLEAQQLHTRRIHLP